MTNQIMMQGGYGYTAEFPLPIKAPRDPLPTDITSDTGAPYMAFQEWQNTLTRTMFFYQGSGVWIQLATVSPINGFPITPFVVGPVGQAGYQTIQSAINAAGTTPSMIYIQPGTYTENLVFPNGSSLSLASLDPDATIISGVHTPPTTGFLHFLELQLTSATNILLSSAAGTAQLTFESCVCTCTQGYTFNVFAWTGTLQSFHCVHGGANNGFCNNSGGSTLNISDSSVGFSPTGLSAQNMVTSGPVNIGAVVQAGVNCVWQALAGTVINASQIQFLQGIIFSSNATGNFDTCLWQTGTTASITQSSSGAVSVSNSTFTSTANPVIAGAGAGTVTITDCAFTSGHNIANTLTVANGISRGGSYVTQYTVGPAPDAQFHTIQAAVTAIGTTPAMLYLQPATYVENITFVAGCNLTIASLSPDSVTINGVHTPPASGFLRFLEVNCNSTTHILSSTAAGTAQLTAESCIWICTDGFSFNVANWTGTIQTFHSVHSGTTNGFLNNGTGSSPVFVSDSTVGAGTALQLSVGAGAISMEQTDVVCPYFTGSGTQAIHFNCSFADTVSIGTATTQEFYNGYFSTAANTAIDFQASAANVGVFNSSIQSTANPCIAGSAGTLFAGNLIFVNNSIVASGVTLSSTSKNMVGGALFFSGSGSPNGSVTAKKGSFYSNLTGSGVADRLWVNTDGGTTWTNVVTAA